MDSEDLLYKNPNTDAQNQEACSHEEDYCQDHGGLVPSEYTKEDLSPGKIL